MKSVVKKVKVLDQKVAPPRSLAEQVTDFRESRRIGLAALVVKSTLALSPSRMGRFFGIDACQRHVLGRQSAKYPGLSQNRPPM